MKSAEIPLKKLSIAECFVDFMEERAEPELKNSLSQLAKDICTNLAVGSTAVQAPTELAEQLSKSRLVGDGTTPTPFVIKNNLASLYRYFKAEENLLMEINSRLNIEESAATKPELVDSFFSASDNPASLAAANILCKHNFCAITGGPGTGKTTLAAKIINFFLKLEENFSVAATAPTGKATARMGQSLQSNGVENVTCKTLHALLGFNGSRFKFHKNNPLPYDMIILDEASMVDTLLMSALFSACKSDAKIILLGDRFQLPSINAGAFFSSLCNSKAQSHSQAIVKLTKNWRFDSQPGLVELAAATRDGDLNIISQELNGVEISSNEDASLESNIKVLVKNIYNATTAKDALGELNKLRFLCATKQGEHSTEAINRLCETELQRMQVNCNTAFYKYRPVMIEKNDYRNELYNGDCGIVWTDENNKLLVYFENGKIIAPSRLPEHSTAWAITIHKSQGSEFYEVVLIMPDHECAILSRELIYTGVTRAKNTVRIISDSHALETALSKPTHRLNSLLG